MYSIGIDLGGTNIAAGIVDEKGNILKKLSTPTEQNGGYEKIVKDMVHLSFKLVDEAKLTLDDIKGVGIGCPGSIDYKNKAVAYSNNLVMDNAPIAEEFKKYWDIPVEIENDANVAAYGEYVANGDNSQVFVAITLGTGVGGGVIIDGNVFRGSNGAGAELGHISLVHNGEPCSCGRKGCWESYASATALIAQTKAAIEKNPESLLAKLAAENGGVNGKIAFDAAAEGDKIAKAVVDKYIEYVADGLVSIVNIFQPNKVVIGGGISNQGEALVVPIREYVKKYDYNRHFTPVEIEIASLKNDAGIIGAAMLVI